VNSAAESWSQRIIGLPPLSRFFQIDRLVRVVTEKGSRTSRPFSLPHARYTVFVDADPPRAALAFSMRDQHDQGIEADWSRIPEDVLGVGVPLVQHELRRGVYRISIDAKLPSCWWQAQVVLNSMLSWKWPPRPWRPLVAPPEPIILRSGDSPAFRLLQTGDYGTDFMIDGFRPDNHVFTQTFCPFNLDLRAADGHLVHLGDGGTSQAAWPRDLYFLGAGDWTVEIETSCEWELVIKPRVGSRGGGTRSF
jgi:hypothetical protein